MSTLALYVASTDANPWVFTVNVTLRFVAFCNPRKTGRHRMWEKHHLQHMVRRDWTRLGPWS